MQLSIIVPNYEYGDFADRFFGSIAGQTLDLDQVEIVFVDDGSRDNSLEQANRWARQLPCARFLILTPPRTGKPGLVRNHGLGHASGELLLCFDPDDALLPGYLERCVNTLLHDTSIDVVYTDYREVGIDAGRDVRLPDFKRGLLRTQNALPSSAMIRRSLWDSGVRFRDNTEYEDWDFWVQCQMAGAAFHRIPEVLFEYTLHDKNFSHHAVRHDGHAKARIVLNNPDFFHPEVRRWADSYLRGRLHGQAMQRGYIPTPADVRKLLMDVETRVRDLDSR